MAAPDVGGLCGIAGCPEPACGASVTFAAPHPIDKVLTEFRGPGLRTAPRRHRHTNIAVGLADRLRGEPEWK